MQSIDPLFCILYVRFFDFFALPWHATTTTPIHPSYHQHIWTPHTPSTLGLCMSRYIRFYTWSRSFLIHQGHLPFTATSKHVRISSSTWRPSWGSRTTDYSTHDTRHLAQLSTLPLFSSHHLLPGSFLQTTFFFFVRKPLSMIITIYSQLASKFCPPPPMLYFRNNIITSRALESRDNVEPAVLKCI